MSIAKTLSLSLAASIMLSTRATPSFAMEYQMQETFVTTTDSSSSSQDDEESIWDYILGWL